MAEGTTPEQRTEMPSDRRMGELRRQGNLFVSMDLVQAATLAAGILVLQTITGPLLSSLMDVMRRSFVAAGDRKELQFSSLHTALISLMGLIGPTLLLLLTVVGSVAACTVMLQTSWSVKEKKIDFRFDMLNPIVGIQRVFSVNGLLQTAKAILKLAILLPIGFFALKGLAPQMLHLPFMSVRQTLSFTSESLLKIFWNIFGVLTIFAIIDFTYGRYRWLRDHKMTKEEVKDERKATEGDETTKRRILSKALQRVTQRIHRTVPRADVVVTNPTHYAVALKYDRLKMKAPTVLAKGQGEVALRIRAIAKESGVPVLERKQLARALYASTKVGSEVPYDLFKAVAEVLAFVYKQKRGRPTNQSANRNNLTQQQSSTKVNDGR